MAATTETVRNAGFLLSEAPGTLSRDTVTLAAGSGVVLAGTVLGKVTSTGKYVPYDDDFLTGEPAAADGRETAVAIALMTTDATADAPCAVITRMAEVKADLLQWASTNDAGDKTAGLADLAARFIITR
jgi:hypothetical protein